MQQEGNSSGAMFVDRDPGTPRAFLITISPSLRAQSLAGAPLNDVNEVVLASSWSVSPVKGIIRFFDDHGRLTEALSIDRVVRVRALTDGPIVWTDGESVDL